MILKNNEQRKQFLEEYKKWELIGEIAELKLNFYKFTLPTNAVIIATEWQSPGNIYVKPHTDVRYSLIIKDNHTGATQANYYEQCEYDLSGTSQGTIVDYLRINKCDIEYSDTSQSNQPTNYERIKNMTVEEMTDILTQSDVDKCFWNGDMWLDKEETIKWLESEAN